MFIWCHFKELATKNLEGASYVGIRFLPAVEMTWWRQTEILGEGRPKWLEENRSKLQGETGQNSMTARGLSFRGACDEKS